MDLTWVLGADIILMEFGIYCRGKVNIVYVDMY
jgi:hypothetical protein